MYESVIKIRGFWEMVLTGPDGELKQHVKGENVITTAGKQYLAAFLNSAATAASTFTARYVGIGTNSTTEAAADTQLGTEIARHTGTVSVSGAVYSVVATFAAGTGTGAIVEYGLLTSNTAGTLFSRDTETVINKGAGDTLTVTTEVTLS